MYLHTDGTMDCTVIKGTISTVEVGVGLSRMVSWMWAYEPVPLDPQ